MEIVWQTRALDQIDEIGLYIAKDSIEQADRVCGMIERSVEVLERHPEFGAVVPEFDDDTVRELRVYQYRIFYRIREDESRIEILIVQHGARQLTGEVPDK